MSDEAIRLLRDDINSFVEEFLPTFDGERCKSDIYLRDPIWGGFRLLPWEREVVDTPLFQRLRLLHQTALVHLIYPGSTHTRFEHSLGVVAGAERLLTSLRELDGCHEVSKADRLTVRLAGLLHDVGHTIFSHLGEKQLDYHPWIRALRETDSRFQTPKTHELLSALIILSPWFSKYFDSLVHAHSKLEPALEHVRIEEIAYIILGHAEGRRFWLAEVINGPFDADKLDYVQRDSLNSGLPMPLDIERLLENCAIVETKSGSECHLALRHRAISVYEQLLFCKMQFAIMAIDHHRVRSANAVFNKYFQFLRANEGQVPPAERFDRPTTFLRQTDVEWLYRDRSTNELNSLSDQLIKGNLPKRALILDASTVKDEDFDRLQNAITFPGYVAYLEQQILDMFSAHSVGHNLTIRNIHLDLPAIPKLGDEFKTLVIKSDGQLREVGELKHTRELLNAFTRKQWKGYLFVSTRDELERLRIAKAAIQTLAVEGVRISERGLRAVGLNPNDMEKV